MGTLQTDKQVKLKFDSQGASSASSTLNNGDVIFDAANKKIYVRGQEFNAKRPTARYWEDIN